MDASYTLPDSTDWLATSLPAFESVEAALRCEVCKEFLSNPVITPCSHTFCSICIRRCITADGKCPSCKTGCSSDKLTPNIAVREVVMRFEEARPKAIELARADTHKKAGFVNGKKRKISETDLEEEENIRHTRSRQTQSKARRIETNDDAPAEIADSEAGSDQEFVPQGMAKCPICNKPMKAELVYNHLDVCTGESASQGRHTRSKTKTAFPTALTNRKKEASPPPARLSQLNYAMLKETALRKKLQELGIPHWGDRTLLKRRHIEWLNIYNSNCDAETSVRKNKRQLLKELDVWEQTQGGRADIKESKIMKKDFDGSSYMRSHKSEFDDLIAQARRKQTAPKLDLVDAANPGLSQPPPPSSSSSPPSPSSDPRPSPSNPTPNHTHPNDPPPSRNPYENNEPALASIRAKVAAANNPHHPRPSLHDDSSLSSAHRRGSSTETGIVNPLGSSSRKVPMFQVPQGPVEDVDVGGGGEGGMV